MSKESKFIRVKGWKKNPKYSDDSKDEPRFIRWMGWRKNPAWEPTLQNIKINDYLTGNIVPVRKVPKEHRNQYRDTLARFALAAYRAGYDMNNKRRVNSSYRFRSEQEALFNQNMISPGVPKPGRPLTAVPGMSGHERGVALDAPDIREEPILLKYCRELGLLDDVPSEGWHLTNRNHL